MDTTTNRLLSGKLVQLGNLLLRSASGRYRSRFGLRNEEWRILALLGSDESLPLTELARRAGLRKSQLSRGAGNLLKKGLLSRVVSREDAREAQTPLRGHTLAEQCREVVYIAGIIFMFGDAVAHQRFTATDTVEKAPFHLNR